MPASGRRPAVLRAEATPSSSPAARRAPSALATPIPVPNPLPDTGALCFSPASTLSNPRQPFRHCQHAIIQSP